MLPQPAGQRTGFVGQFASAPGVVDGGQDLGAIAHDARVAHQALDVGVGVARHAFEIEVVEGLAERLALAQDGDPRHPCLEAFQADLFVQPAVVPHRPAPFMVVVVGHGRLPEATRQALAVQDQTGRLPRRAVVRLFKRAHGFPGTGQFMSPSSHFRYAARSFVRAWVSLSRHWLSTMG
ncbi:hypothetical protein D3C72_1799710 [compost metagenome]